MEQRVVKPPNSKVQRPELWPESFLKESYANYRRTGQRSTRWPDLLQPFLLKSGGRRITMPGSPGGPISISQPALDKYGLEAHEEALQIMEQRGWVTLEQSGSAPFIMTDTITLTPAGIDHARWFCRPLYIRMWDFMKGDVRTIIVGGISGVVAAVLTIIIIRVLGLG